MRELTKPTGIEGDGEATEMMRIWLAHQDLHISLLLGMWADAEDSDVDERAAWGELLSDTIKHIANGLHQSHGMDKIETATAIRDALLANLSRSDGVVSGTYIDDAPTRH